MATITLADAAPGAKYHWDVKTGECGSTGSVVGMTSAYPAVTIGADHSGREEATLKTQLKSGAEYHVDLTSSSKSAAPIACGDLKSTKM